MPDRNVTVGVKADSYHAAQFVIEGFGPVQQSGIGNGFTLKVDVPGAFVAQVANLFDTEPGIMLG